MTKVLIIEDSMTCRVIINSILREAGCIIKEVEDINNSVKEAEEFLPDLIVLDLGLGDISGIDVCREIRKSEVISDVVILITTGFDDAEMIEEAFSAGADDYSVKPIKPSLFIHRIKSMLSNDKKKKQLKKINKKYNSIINALPDLVWTVNEENVVTGMHIPAEFSTILPNEEAYVGKHISEYLPEELVSMCINSIKESRETNKVVTISYPLEVHGILTWEDSRFIRINGEILCVTRDMTELYHTEKNLESALSKLKALISSIPDPIWVVNRRGIVEESYNTQYYNATTRIKDVFSGCCKSLGRAVFDAVERAIDTKTTQQFVYDSREQEKSFEVRVTYVENNLALVMLREITYLCKTKTSIDKATSYIDESSKLVDEIKRMTKKMIMM